jgi:hypothetical protein
MRILAMSAVKSLRLKGFLRAAFGATLLLVVASSAWAQATQNLTIAFQGGNATAIPLSNWTGAGIAVLISLTAVVVLRWRSVRGGRFFGAMVAVVAGTTMLGIVGQRPISEAQALVPVTIINLTISPAVLNVGPFAPSPVTAQVTNTTGQSVQITSITLAPGFFVIGGATTCVTSLVLAPSQSCSIALVVGT